VEKDAKLGLSGSSGRVTGPHVHFGVRWNGAWLDSVQLVAITLPKTEAAETMHPVSAHAVRKKTR
jgi:murein DD-endopeptidase MepM/ murein hydrolase activator NlpD